MIEWHDMIVGLFWGGAALLLTLGLVPVARRFAIHHGFVDQPGGRKDHEIAVPPVGGIVIFAVFLLISLFSESSFEGDGYFILSLVLILGVGIVDDYRGVPASLKFLIHFIVGFLVVVGGGAELVNLGNLLGFGDISFDSWGGVLFSVACVVYILNAINMMDGMDGLAAGKSLIIFVWLGIAAALSGYGNVIVPLMVLIGALVGFLFYNARHPLRDRASIFLGDAGSMALGLCIAWFAINLTQGDDPALSPISVAWIIALPIIDAFGLLVARLKDGKHPFEADRRHFHHHFLAAGFTPAQATPLILLWGFTLGAFGYVAALQGLPEPILGWAWVALWWGHAYIVMRPDGFVKFLSFLREEW
jgi:UDP-GlcNAc:undecaprenyl-phosphate/decaprenyl-phosphate GlcNAc-1-phosphate transferase